MNNKVFTTWFKELCSLVFVQSMQALLMAIMLAVVINMYVADTSYAAKQSMGVYAIIILALLPKVELLVKRIFGLGSGVMDDSMQGGQKSLGKGLIAWQLGKRVLNNAGKIAGGVGKMTSSAGSAMFGSVHRKKSLISKNNEKALQEENSNDKSATLPGASNRPLGKSNSNRNTNGSGGQVSMNNLTEAIKSANAEDPREAYEKAKLENRKKAREGFKEAVSGLVETTGAVQGASLGAVYSLGTGGDNLVSNMVSGAGIGDAVGEGLTNATLGTTIGVANTLSDWNYGRKQFNRQKDKSNEKLKAAKEYNKTVGEARKVQQPVGTKSAKRTVSEARKVQQPAGTKSAKRTVSEARKVQQPVGTNSTKRTIKAPKISETQKAANEVVKQMDNLHDQYAVKAAVSKINGDKAGHEMYKGVMNNIDRDIDKFKKQSQKENQVKYKPVKRPNNSGGTGQSTQSNTSSRREEETFVNLGKAINNYEIARRKNQPNTRKSATDETKKS